MCVLVLPALRKQTASGMVSPFTKASSVQEYAQLLESGTDPNQVQDDGSNAFFSCCCEFGTNDNLTYYRSVIRLLLDHGADLNRIDMRGQTALQKSESDAFSVAMLEAGASVRSAPRPDNFSTDSVLVSSCRKGHVAATEYLIEQLGVSSSAFLGRGTALHHLLYGAPLLGDSAAAEKGLETIVRHTACLDQRDFLGRTPLYLVYESSNMAKIVLESGADLTAKIPQGWWFHREVFDSMVGGFRLNNSELFMNGRPWEMVQHSVHYRAPDVLRLLLDRGAAVDAVDSDGNTPLMRLLLGSSLNSHVHRVFELLLTSGASCVARNHAGEAVVDMPLATRYPLLMSRLRERGREQNWSRRRSVFLIMARGGDSEHGALKIMANMGLEASLGFVRHIVEYV